MTATSDNKPRELFSSSYLVRLALPILWSAIICWLSLTSTPPLVPGLLGWDKLQHALAYTLLTILVAQYLCLHCHDSWKAGFYAACFAVVYGGLMEVLQLTVQTGRLAEWWDLIADIIGAFLGCVIFRQVSVVISQYDARDETHG